MQVSGAMARISSERLARDIVAVLLFVAVAEEVDRVARGTAKRRQFLAVVEAPITLTTVVTAAMPSQLWASRKARLARHLVLG